MRDPVAHLHSVDRRERGALDVARSLALACALVAPTVSQGNPQGAQVVHGTASFAMPNGSTLNITNSPGAIINWQQFGIGPGEVTRFLQQNAASAVLNRVVGGDPSAILGSLLSNGQVFLINPNGVVFGPNAVVDTAGLVVSTLNMLDEDFIAGRLHFSGDGGSGTVTNEGRIHATGSVVLIAPRIENSGIIESDGGELLLAAGHEVTITSLEDPEISYQLKAPEHEVVNLGRLVSRGGAASVFAGSIRHSGDIDASAVTVGVDGRVRLVAQADVTLEAGSRIAVDGARGGVVQVESEQGTLLVDGAEVSATGGEGRGGEVHLLGERVGLTGDTVVDVSGGSGGGEALVGGDLQGTNPEVHNAQDTFVGSDVVIRADAENVGDGGKVIVWSDGSTEAAGKISARGGDTGGDGGFVEVSAKGGLRFDARVDTLAPAGRAGTILIDPPTLDIVDQSVTPGVDQIGEDTVETLTGAVVLTADETLTVQDLTTDGILDIDAAATSFTLETTASSAAGGIVFLNPANTIRSNGAGVPISLIAGGAGSLSNIGNLTSSGATAGNIDLAAGGNIALRGLVQSTGTVSGDATIVAGGNVDGTGGGIRVRNLKITAGTGINLLSPGNSVQQLTASNSTSGDIQYTNDTGPLSLAPNGTAFAVSNTASNGFINIASIGTGAALTVNGLVEAPNGTSNQLQLQTPGLFTVSPGSAVNTPGTVFFLVEDATIQAPVSGGLIEVNGFNTGNVALGVNNAVGNGTLELSQADINQLNASGILSLGFGSTQNITVTGPVTVTNTSTEVRLTSNIGLGIDINAPLDVGTRTLNLTANGAGTGDGEVRQSAAGVLTAGVLTVTADQGIFLNNAVNQVGGLTATSSAALSSGIQLTNDSGGIALALNAITSSNGAIGIANSGGTSITGVVDAGMGNVSISDNTLDINAAGGTVTGNNITLSAPSGGIGNGNKVLTNVAGTLTLRSGGSGGAGNISVEEADALTSSSVIVTTDSVSSQGVRLATATGPLTVDSTFGDPLDDLDLSALAGPVLATAGAVTARALNLAGATGVDLTGATFGATAGAAIDGGSGGIRTAAGSRLTAAGPVSLSAAGDVLLNSTGITDVDATGQTVSITSLGGRIFNGGATGTIGDVKAATLGLGAATGVELDTDVTSLSVSNSTANNIRVINTGAAGALNLANAINAAAGGFVSVENRQNGIVLGNASANGGPVDILASTAGGVGSIIDGNGGGINVAGSSAVFSAAGGIGSLTDPLETQIVTLQGASTSSGSVAIANTGPLDFAASISTAAGGDILLAGTGGLNLRSAFISSGNQLVLDGGSGLLLVDNSSVGASATLTARAADIDYYSSFVSGNDIVSTSSNVTHLQAGSGFPVDLSASNAVDISAGELLVEAGAFIGDSAKISAGNAVTLNAGNVTVRGGAGTGAFAIIDPLTLTVNAAGDILLEGGPTPDSDVKLIADNLVALNAGGAVTIRGLNAGAGVESIFGNVDIVAVGPVTLEPGLDPAGDAVIIANAGAGTVTIDALDCVNCLLLGADPFAAPQDVVADTGVFAGSLLVTTPFVAPLPVVAEPGETIERAADEILALEEVFEQLTVGDGSSATGADDEDDEDRKLCN